SYFEKESDALEDIDLQQETVVLQKLSGFEGDEIREVRETTSPTLGEIGEASADPPVDAPMEEGYQVQEPAAKVLKEIETSEKSPLSMSIGAISLTVAVLFMRSRRR
ncbi:MAG: hypothetical protein WDA01_11770, partial [Methanothrix sp.]